MDKAKKPAEKKLTTKQKLALCKEMLLKLQEKRYHEPDSDAYEYCNGCHRSPYNHPPHDADCLVPAIAALLKKV